MPTYEYVCTDCGMGTEVEATIAEKQKGLKVTCPDCGSEKTAQVFQALPVMRSSRASRRPPMCGPRAGSGCCR